jgi:enoyl-CoA hydratase/carnithine racemase
MGLISRVVVDEEFQSGATEIIEQVRLTAPGARRAVKRDINRHLPRFDLEMFADSLLGAEVAEGFGAFTEKRKPSWVKRS